MIECEICGKFFTDNKLKRHKAYAHGIGLVMQKCDVEDCDFECKDPDNLKKHKAYKHDIGVLWQSCDQPGCEAMFKSGPDLRRHKAAVHGTNIKWRICSLCDYKAKTPENLDRHTRNVHYIGTIWYECSECDHKCKNQSDLDKHLSGIHNIGIVWHHCDLCEYKSKTTEGLYTHKQGKHLINVKWHPCGIDNCQYKAKRKHLLKEHQGYLHDIGDEKCDYCLGLRYKLTPYKENNRTVNLCRACYRKATGRTSRIETIMSNYLDKHFGIEYLIGSDTKLYGEACQRYRPDKIYASPGVVLHVECDEEQHLHTSNNYSCDEKRISDIYDEFPGNKYIVIRWNPDRYTVPKKKVKVTSSIERMELLLTCMMKLVQDPPEEPIKVIYMFYDKDNPLITKNLAHALVYDEDDIESL